MSWLSKNLDLKTIILIMLFVGIVVWWTSAPTPPTNGEIINIDGTDYELVGNSTDTVFIYINRIDSVYIPTHIEHIRVDTVILPVIVDSLQIIKSYFSTNRYYDTIPIAVEIPDNIKATTDSIAYFGMGYIVIRDDISQNRNMGRQLTWNYRFPIIYNTTFVKDLPKREYFIGFTTGINSNFEITHISSNFYIKNKKFQLYNFSVGLVPNYSNNSLGISPYIGGGVAWKLNF